MSASEHGMDRAAWRRYRTDNKDRCMVCNKPTEVVILLQATEINAPARKTGQRKPRLAAESFTFCNVHALPRFGEALGRLRNIGGKVED